MADDEAARKARAESLRQKIASLKSGQTDPVEASENESESESGGHDTTVDKETPSGESPREFINRRMRELDNKD